MKRNFWCQTQPEPAQEEEARAGAAGSSSCPSFSGLERRSLRCLLLDRLCSWSIGQLPPTSPANDLAVRQTLLGWRLLFEGCPALGWRQAQQSYYDSIGSSKTGKRGLTQLLLKLVSIAWDLWEVCNGVLHKKVQC